MLQIDLLQLELLDFIPPAGLNKRPNAFVDAKSIT